MPSDCDSSTVFCRLSYRSILSISSVIQWRCLICKKVCRNIAFITAFFFYISSAVASVQMARRFSSFSGCSPWLLAHILNLKSKIKTKKNRLIFTYGEQHLLESLSEIHISKKTITHFLLLIEDGSEGAAIWLFLCWIVQSSHAQSHQNEFHFNLKRLFFLSV